MEIVLIVGLPCSGKSTFLKTFPDSLWNKIDDPASSINFEHDGRNLAIADPNFIFNERLQNAIKKLLNEYKDFEPKLSVIYFENNPEKCLINYKLRVQHNDSRCVENFIKNYSKYYNPPETVITIWQP